MRRARVLNGGPMAARDPESGETPVGGSRRPPRPPLNVFPKPAPVEVGPDAQETWPFGEQPASDQASGGACPWLYLLADPDAREAAVTAEHRCEIRPDEVPGPGHQLAYCLGANHSSCPQLRSYEAQRYAAAASARERGAPSAPSSAPTGASEAGPPRIERFGRGTPPGRQRSKLLGRAIWAATGAVGAIALVAGLAIYAAPDVLSLEPGSEPSVSAEAASPAASVGGAPSGSGAGAEPSATSTPRPERPSVYTVQAGDTLGKIARDLGISVGALVAENHITADTVVVVGDELRVPALLAGPPADESGD